MAWLINGGFMPVDLFGVDAVGRATRLTEAMKPLIPGGRFEVASTVSRRFVAVRATATNSRQTVGEYPLPLVLQPIVVRTESLLPLEPPGPRTATVRVANAAPVPVVIYDVASDGSEKRLAMLRPAAAPVEPVEMALPGLSAGQVLRARLQISGGELAVYVVPEAGGETPIFDIDVRTRTADVPVQMSFENRSSLDLQLGWVDFDGSEKRTRTVRPGERVDAEHAYAMSPWVVKDTHSGVIVDVLMPEPAPSAFAFTGYGLRSVGGSRATKVELWNAAPFAVVVRWIDAEGIESTDQPIEFAAGETKAVRSFAGHVWRIRRRDDRADLGVFVASAAERQAYTITESPPGKPRPPTIELVNLTGTTVEIVRDIGRRRTTGKGDPTVFRTLRPGDRYGQPTTSNVQWRVRDARTARPLGVVTSSVDGSSHELHARGVRALSSQIPVEVRFQNRTPFDVDLYQIDFNGTESHHVGIRPGADFVADGGYATGAWRVREHESQRLLGLFLATEDPTQTYTVEFRPLHSKTPIRRDFENDSSLTVEVVTFGADGSEVVPAVVLLPNDRVSIDTFLTHPWIVRDQYSQRVVAHRWGYELKTKTRITDLGIRQRESLRSTTTRVRNHLPFHVDYYAVDFDGKEELHGTLKKGRQISLVGWMTQPWRFRAHGDGSDVAMLLPRDVAQQDFELRLRALRDFGDPLQIPTKRKQHERSGKPWELPPQCSLSTVRVRNTTPLNVRVYWVDHEGAEHLAGAIATREERTWDTYSTYPWVVRDARSGEIVTFTRAAKEPTTLDVWSKTVKLQRAQFEFETTVKNEVGWDLELYPIDAAGEEVAKHKRRLPKGQTIALSTFASEPWRARLADRGTEVDLFIATETERHVKLENKLYRHGERPDKVLWPGEVAVYPKPDLAGRPWILYADLPDFAAVPGLDNHIQSLRLGPGSVVTVYEGRGFSGATDVYYMDQERFDAGDVKPNTMSSIAINRLLSAEEVGIKTTNAVTEEVEMDAAGKLRKVTQAEAQASKGRLKADEVYKDTVYRTTLQLPPEVKTVDVRLLKDDGPRRATTPSAEQTEKDLAAIRSFLSGMGAQDFPVADVATGLKILKTLRGTLAVPAKLVGVRAAKGFERIDGLIRELERPPSPALEPLKIRVGNETLDISETKSQRLIPNAAQQLVIQIESNRLDVPPLLVRTNLMARTQELLIFPTADAHAKIAERSVASMAADLAESGAVSYPAGEAGDAKKAYVTSALQAVQTVSRAVPHGRIATGSGTRQDRAVDLSLMEMSAFELSLDSKNPGFRPFDASTLDTTAIAERPIAMGDVLDDIGTGFKIIIKGAVSGTIEAAKLFTDDETDAKLDQAKRDANESIDAGVDWVVEASKVVVETLVETGKQFLEAVVEVGGKLVKFVIDTAEKVGAFIQNVVEKIVEAVKQFIAILKSLLEWADVQETMAELATFTGQAFAFFSDAIVDVRAGLKKLFAWLRNRKDGLFDSIASHLGIELDDEPSDNGSSGAMDVLSWVMDKLIGGVGATDVAENVPAAAKVPSAGLPSSISAKLKGQLDAAYAEFTDATKRVAGEGLSTVATAVEGLFDVFGELFTDPTQAPKVIIKVLLQVGKGLLGMALSVVEAIMGVLLDLAVVAVNILSILIDESLSIPLVAELFEWMTDGKRLNLKNLACLLIAVPATIVGKIVGGGERPKFVFATPETGKSGILGQEFEEDAPKPLAYLMGAGNLVLGFFDLLTDGLSGYLKGKYRWTRDPINVLRGIGLVTFTLMYVVVVMFAAVKWKASLTNNKLLSFDSYLVVVIALMLGFALGVCRFAGFFISDPEVILGWNSVVTMIGFLLLSANVALLLENPDAQDGSTRSNVAVALAIMVPLPALLKVGTDKRWNSSVRIGAAGGRLACRIALSALFFAYGALPPAPQPPTEPT